MRFSSIFSPLPKCEIDPATGVIKGVSVITAGEVSGHECFADSQTLREVRDIASAFRNGVKVKDGHATGGTGAIIGTLRNFQVDGDQTRADFHLLKKSTRFDAIIEMAQTIPDQFGFSIDFSGPREAIGDKKFARCKELYSIDLVDAPAANPRGLFSKDNDTKPMLDQKFLAKTLGLPETATEQEVADAFTKRMAAPAAPDLAPIMAKLEKLEKASAPGDVAASLEKLNLTVKALETESQAARAGFEKGERKALVEQATREGKVLPLTDEEIYGSEKFAAIPLPILKNMVAKLEKTVPLAPTQLKPITDEDRKSLPAKLEAARKSAVEGWNQFFSKATATPSN
jgi:hypothetical protein